MSGGLPAGWTTASIEELCEVNPKHDRGIPDDTPVSFVPMAAVSEIEGAIAGIEVRTLGEVRSGYTHFAEGDVLWAKITPCMENGKAAVAEGLLNGLGCGTTEFFVLRSRGAVLPTFLHLYMRQQSYRKQARSTMQSGVGQARVPREFIANTIIDLPPLAEQNRIVTRLKLFQVRSQAIAQVLGKIPPMLEQFRQSVLAAAFRGDLTTSVTALPLSGENRQNFDVDSAHDQWENTTIADVTESSFYGPRFGAEEYSTDGVPTLRTSDIDRYGRITLNDPPRVHVDDDQFERFRLKPGDLIVTRTGATIGKCAVYEEHVGPALPSAYLIRFRLRQDRIVPRFLLYFLLSQDGQQQMGVGITAVAQPNVNARAVGAIRLPLPTLRQQLQIVQALDSVFARTDAVQRFAVELLDETIRLDESILTKAFRGELVPQDPSDEPASVLLERIRAEREAVGGMKRRGRT